MKGNRLKLRDVRVNLRDITLTKSQDFSKCANCYISIVKTVSHSFQDKLYVDTQLSASVVEALTDIFELPKKIHLSSIRLDEKDLRLCSCCFEKLQNLYLWHTEFVRQSRYPSFINSVVKYQGVFKRSVGVPVKIKEEIADEGEAGTSKPDENSCEGLKTNLRQRKRRRNYLAFSKHGYEEDEFESSEDDATQDLDYTTSEDILHEENNSKNGEKEEGSTNQCVSDSNDEQSTSELATQKKQKRTDRKRYGCEVCSETFSRAEYLRRHRNCHNKSNFTCPTCNAGFTREAKREQHMKFHDPNYKKKEEVVVYVSPVKTEGTDRSFIKKLGNGLQECKICGKVMPSSQNMLQHVITHKGEADKTFTCEFCGSSYKTKACLRNHQQNHEDARHICKICDQIFKRRQQLKEHQAIKHENRPKSFVCPVPDCNAAFYRMRNLKEHSRKHGNIKYPCELGCGALFTYKYNRKTHQERYCTLATTLKSKRIRKKKQRVKQQDEDCIFLNSDNDDSFKDNVAKNAAFIAAKRILERSSTDNDIPTEKNIFLDTSMLAQNISLIQLPESVSHLITLPAEDIDLSDATVLYEFVVE
ncbi:unnamed protein product [Allacma fusca]|uniref:C2H2-type domain-containing protein n=1 Tax=Allacma fusca TaxID=39272 RepID=A0A8J2JFR9_9HEXA|nr:unnamed protein product [Allacma fusca]